MVKIIALEDVRVFGNVVTQESVNIGGHLGTRPANEYKWVFLKKGNTFTTMSIFLGIYPKYLPSEDAEFRHQAEYVPFYSGRVSPAFLALVRVE